MDAFEMPEQRALLISRTEVNRAYRLANWETMKSSKAVKGYRRMCYPPTACFACLVLDGEFYPLNSAPCDHPNGKCSFVPVTEHYDPINAKNRKRGQDWLMEQDEETQRRIMGAGRFELWKNGEITDPRKFALVRENETWGGSPALLRLENLGLFDFIGTTAADGTVITGFSNHSLSRIEERHVSLYGIEEALTNPITIEDKSRPESPAKQLSGAHALVRINPKTGNVITAMKGSGK